MSYIPIEGGKVLGKGVYGCIVTPAPECSGMPADPTMVGKLLMDESEIAAEIEGYMRISEIDPFHTFSMYSRAPFPCESALKYVSPEDRAKCKLARDIEAPMKTFLFGKLQGMTFSDVIERNPDPRDMLVLIMRILLALSIMEGRVSHFDLHSKNIFVVNPEVPPAPAAPSAPPTPVTAVDDSKYSLGSPLSFSLGIRRGVAAVVDDLTGGGELETAMAILRSEPRDVFLAIPEATLKSYMQRTLREKGIKNPAVIRAAIKNYLDDFYGTYFRASREPRWSDWRPIIIDYGMVRSVNDYVKYLDANKDFNPFHWYFSHDFMIAYEWANNFAFNSDRMLLAVTKDIDYTDKRYSRTTGSDSSPSPWVISSEFYSNFKLDSNPSPEKRQTYNLINSSLEPDFLRILYEYYRRIIYGELRYSASSKKARNDFWQMVVLKHDLFVFMLSIVTEWDYSKHTLEPHVKEICDELAYLARMVVSYDIFKRPLAYQVYNYMIPLFERAGFEMDAFVVASEPFETFKYMKGTLNHEETGAYAKGLPKIKASDNPLLMRNIKVVEDHVLGKRSTDPYTTEADSDMLYAWYTRSFGRP